MMLANIDRLTEQGRACVAAVPAQFVAEQPRGVGGHLADQRKAALPASRCFGSFWCHHGANEDCDEWTY